MRWVNRLLSNNNDTISQAAQTHQYWSQGHFRLSQLEKKGRFISIADIQTKVVKLVALTPMRLLTLSIWIQITIHPLSTDGAIAI